MGEILKNRNLRQLALISLFFGFTEAMFSLRATFLAANGLNATQVGVVFSISGVVGTIAPLLGGVLADRFLTRYKVFIASLFGKYVLKKDNVCPIFLADNKKAAS